MAAATVAITVGVAAVALSGQKRKKNTPVGQETQSGADTLNSLLERARLQGMSCGTTLNDWKADQLVVDVFGAAQAKAWFKEKSGDSTDGKQMLVACLTEDMQKQLKLTGEQLDPEHYLVLALMEGGQTRCYQLVNYGQLAPNFRQLLEQYDGKVLFQG